MGDDDDKHKDVCVICWSDDVRGGKCSENHFTCIDCFNLHVESTFSTSNASNLDPRRMKSLGCKDGRLRCPQSFPSLGETNMCHSEPYDSKSLLTLLNPDNLTRVMNAFGWAKEQAMFEKKTRQYSQSIQCLAEKYNIAVKIQQDRTLLSEQIQREMPNARQCKECNYGPIDHGWCDNLKTHHGETKTSGGQISNACPKCGWFGFTIKEWPKWNGILPAEVDASTEDKKKKKSNKPLTEDLKNMVDQKVLTDEQAREMMPYDPDDEDDNDTKDTNDDEDSVDENGVRSVLRLNRYHGITLFLISTFLFLRIPYDLLCLVIDSASWCWYSFSFIFGTLGSVVIIGAGALHLMNIIQNEKRNFNENTEQRQVYK